MRQIGYIYANIDGDGRYGVTLRVSADDTAVEWRAYHTGAVGGMDGPGGSYDAGSELLRREDRPVSPAAVARITRNLCNADHIIARYGTPTKSFSWNVGGMYSAPIKGISAAKAKQALEAV